MNDLNDTRQLKTPWGPLLLTTVGASFLLFCVAVMAYQTYESHAPLDGILVIGLVIVLAGNVKWVIRYAKLSRLEMRSDGFEETIRDGSVLRRWEEVVRYQPLKNAFTETGFTLFYKDGSKVWIPAQVEGFQNIKGQVLKKLEAIGKFEDGRTVPREIGSISYKTLLWIFLAIIAIVSLIIWLR